MNEIQAIRRRRRKAHRSLLERKSKVYKAFLDLEAAAYGEGVLPKKTKELIAVGISVVMDCESCMEWHITQAIRCGASQAEILEAIEVGIEMGGGRATVSARFALEALEAITAPKRQDGE